ncbi:MAG: type II secretion system F family protein, partial [Thermoleophilia bacterium]|nr:type II secretion system F family protein [Thermoleophilia bacterium]
MASYAFRAVDVGGVPANGKIEAPTKGQVTEQLRQRGLIVLDVSEQRDALKLESLFERFQRVSMRDLAVFSRQFATLIASGMPMLRSLYTLEEQTEDKKIKEAAAGLRADVEAGSSVAQAMDRHPVVFDPLYRS